MSVSGYFSGNHSNNSRRFVYFGLICIIFFLFYLTINEIGPKSTYDYHKASGFVDYLTPPLENSSLKSNRSLYSSSHLHPITIEEAPKVLLWTGLYQDGTWENSVEKLAPCGVYITRQRKYLAEAKIIIFHWRNLEVTDLPPKLPDQKWIWYHSESPHHTWRSNIMSSLQSKFDCWASYRQDSDFYIPYGRILPRTTNETKKLNQKTIRLASKPKSIAWMVSNCKAPSGRDDFVRQLSKFMQVDIYGACGKLKCSLPSDFRSQKCWQKMANEYKFYLSFENSICRDYFTEKVVNILDLDIIPIVFGGASYSTVLPEHSFINALDFQSPQQLANYLNYLSNNETAYNEYFTWKHDYSVQLMIPTRYHDIFCLIHQGLSGPNPKQCQGTNGVNLIKWWYGDANCKKWKPDKGLVDFHVY